MSRRWWHTIFHSLPLPHWSIFGQNCLKQITSGFGFGPRQEQEKRIRMRTCVTYHCIQRIHTLIDGNVRICFCCDFISRLTCFRTVYLSGTKGIPCLTLVLHSFGWFQTRSEHSHHLPGLPVSRYKCLLEHVRSLWRKGQLQAWILWENIESHLFIHHHIYNNYKLSTNY